MNPLEELEQIIDSSYAAFKSVKDEEWNNKSNPEKWSKKEILGHLIDSANTNLRRFVHTQYEQKVKIIYHQDEWVALQHYQEADNRENIELWKLLNLQILRTIEKISSDKLENICDTGKNGIDYQDLGFLIADYVVHMKHHLKQII